MSLKRLLGERLIYRKSVSFKEIDRMFLRSEKTLKSARILLKQDNEDSFELAYKSMLIAGRCLMFALGCRPRVNGSHKTTVDFCEIVLGKEYVDLVNRFNRARKKRNDLIYSAKGIVSKTEAESLIKTVEQFLKIIEDEISKQKKQDKLI